MLNSHSYEIKRKKILPVDFMSVMDNIDKSISGPSPTKIKYQKSK